MTDVIKTQYGTLYDLTFFMNCFKSLGMCHARVREILSYLHIPKTTTVCYMYEANNSDKEINAISVAKQRIKV